MLAKKAKIKSLRSKGLTYEQIGAKVGLSSGGVAWHLNN